MLTAVFNIMWLRLWRDKGALILAFILPGFIFAIFAAIFANASGGNLDLRISMALASKNPAIIEFGEQLQAHTDFTLSTQSDWTQETIKTRVRLGQDDAGFILTENLFTVESSGNNGPSDQSVTYYIGATAILFLLFSAMQGAAISLDERRSGISDRLLIGPKGTLAMLLGKFLFLSLIGTLQAFIILGVAHIFFEVPIANSILPLSLACLGSAALASGIALLTASLCGSTAQMNTVSTFIVLLFSAIGGSMVPRFMMPDWLQSLGRFTPNNWAIEAFYGILARGQTLTDLLDVWYVLFGGALICVLGLAGTLIILWLSTLLYNLFIHKLTDAPLWQTLGLIALLNWLYVGAFIIAHDTMHGSLWPTRPRVNAVLGISILFLYAGFNWRYMRTAHHAHHDYPGTDKDPDFHADNPTAFWPWYYKFFTTYFGLKQVFILAGFTILLIIMLAQMLFLHGCPY